MWSHITNINGKAPYFTTVQVQVNADACRQSSSNILAHMIVHFSWLTALDDDYGYIDLRTYSSLKSSNQYINAVGIQCDVAEERAKSILPYVYKDGHYRRLHWELRNPLRINLPYSLTVVLLSYLVDVQCHPMSLAAQSWPWRHDISILLKLAAFNASIH